MDRSHRQLERSSTSTSSSSVSPRHRPSTNNEYIASFNPFATVERDENFPDFDQAIGMRNNRNNDSFCDDNNRSTASNGSNTTSILSISVRAALTEHNRHVAVHGLDAVISSLHASDEEKTTNHHHHHTPRDPRDVEWERLLNSSRMSSESLNHANNINNQSHSTEEHIRAEGETIEVMTNVSDFFNSSQVLLLSTPEHARNVTYAHQPTRRNECYSDNSFNLDDYDEDDDSHHPMRHMVRLATTTTLSDTSNNTQQGATNEELISDSCEAFANVDLSRISADGSCQMESSMRQQNESISSHETSEFTSMESPKRKKDRIHPYTVGTVSSSPYSSPSRGSRLVTPRSKLYSYNTSNNSSRGNDSFAPPSSKWNHQTTTPPRPLSTAHGNNNSPPSLFGGNSKMLSDDVPLDQLGLSPISKKAADSARQMMQTDNWKMPPQSAVASFPNESLSLEHSVNPLSSGLFEQQEEEEEDHSRLLLHQTQQGRDSVSPMYNSSSEQKQSRSTESSDLKKSSLSSISPNSSSEHHVTTKKNGGESSSLSKSSQSSRKKLLSSHSWIANNDTRRSTSEAGKSAMDRPPRSSSNSVSIHSSSSTSVHSAFDPTDRRRFRTVVPIRAYMTEPSEFPLEDDSFSTTSFSTPHFSTSFTGGNRISQDMLPQKRRGAYDENTNSDMEIECHSAPARTSRAAKESDVTFMSPALRERLFLHHSR